MRYEPLEIQLEEAQRKIENLEQEVSWLVIEVKKLKHDTADAAMSAAINSDYMYRYR